MIKSISPTGKFTQVTNGQAQFPYISPGTHGAGQLRWNSNMNVFEVNNGTSWVEVPSNYTNVGLTQTAEDILDWALQKMVEERELASLAKISPAVQAAVDNLKRAKDQLKTTVILSREHETNEETTS